MLDIKRTSAILSKDSDGNDVFFASRVFKRVSIEHHASMTNSTDPMRTSERDDSVSNDHPFFFANASLYLEKFQSSALAQITISMLYGTWDVYKELRNAMNWSS